VENRYLLQVIVLGERQLVTLVWLCGDISWYLGVLLLEIKPVSDILLPITSFFPFKKKNEIGEHVPGVAI